MVFDYDRNSDDKETLRTSEMLLELFDHDTDPPNAVLCNEKFNCFPDDFESHVYQDVEGTNEMKSEARKFLGLKNAVEVKW